MRSFVIGDIHGEYDTMRSLLARLELDANFIPEHDRLILLGDYVDRGPDSQKVVEWLRESLAAYPHWIALKGNHEQMMIDALRPTATDTQLQTWWYQGGKATSLSYANPVYADLEPGGIRLPWPHRMIPHADIIFLDNLPTGYEDDRYVFVHAGLEEGKRLVDTDDQTRLWQRARPPVKVDDKIVIHGHTPVTEAVFTATDINIDTLLGPRHVLTALEVTDSDRNMTIHQQEHVRR